MDPKLSPAQAGPDHDGDAVLLAPKDLTDAEEALSKLAARPHPTDYCQLAKLTDSPIPDLPAIYQAAGRANFASFVNFQLQLRWGRTVTSQFRQLLLHSQLPRSVVNKLA